MKKNMLLTMSAALLAAMLLAGCGGSTPDTGTEQETTAPQTGSAAAGSAGQTGADTTEKTVTQDAEQEESGEYITRAKAEKIARKDAGVKASQTEGMHVALDTDDIAEGEPAVYDVEFYADMVEYDYEIDAVTGEILSRDQDAESISQSDMQTSDADVISAKKARSIALNHAGFDQSDVTGLYAELDYDDGRYEYEVEFYRGGMEYSYEINAETGDIISYESERDD